MILIANRGKPTKVISRKDYTCGACRDTAAPCPYKEPAW